MVHMELFDGILTILPYCPEEYYNSPDVRISLNIEKTDYSARILFYNVSFAKLLKEVCSAKLLKDVCSY